MTTGLSNTEEERDAAQGAPVADGAGADQEKPVDATTQDLLGATIDLSAVMAHRPASDAAPAQAAPATPAAVPLSATLPDPAVRGASEEERRDVPDGFFDAQLVSALTWDDESKQAGEESEQAPEGSPEQASEESSEQPKDDDQDAGRIDAAVGYVSDTTVYDEADTAPVQTRHTRIRIAAVVICMVAALAVVYGFGVRRFSARLLPNTSINGLDVSTLTRKEAQVALREQTKAYSCAVSVGDLSFTVKGQDISYKRAEATMAQAALAEQSAYAWPLALVRSEDLRLDDGVTYDREELTRLVTAAVDERNQGTLPTDGVYVSFDEAQGLYVVQGSTSGKAVEAAPLVEAVEKDLAAMSATSEPAVEEVTHDATLQDLPQFAPAVDAVNRSRTTDKNITVGGQTVLVADAPTCAQWVWLDDSAAPVVDYDALRSWAENVVAWAVFHSDDWSNYYLDVDKFVDEFARRLKEGVAEDYEAPTFDELRTEGESRQLAYERGGWNEELGRYIDVDLESQFARLFDANGEVLWESAFVSGDMYEGHDTVTGTFNIYAMQTSQVLVGMDYDNDGEPDYESFVNYWMPFYGGYGLHDATWRSNFGGAYYYYNGSHGCVNLPYSKAEALFGMTFVGETVHVHW